MISISSVSSRTSPEKRTNLSSKLIKLNLGKMNRKPSLMNFSIHKT